MKIAADLQESQARVAHLLPTVAPHVAQILERAMADHELSRSGNPAQRMDRLNRIVEFFDRFVQNERPAPVLESTGAIEQVGLTPAGRAPDSP